MVTLDMQHKKKKVDYTLQYVYRRECTEGYYLKDASCSVISCLIIFVRFLTFVNTFKKDKMPPRDKNFDKIVD